MTDTPRLSIQRWAQIALSAVLVLYGIAGFPTPQNPHPQQAAAQSNCWVVCPGGSTTVIYDDGTTVVITATPSGETTVVGTPPPYGGAQTTQVVVTDPINQQSTTYEYSPNTQRPTTTTTTSTTSNCVGVHADGCEQGIEQGYIRPDDDLGANPNTERLVGMAEQFSQENSHLGFDAEAFEDALSNAENPNNPNRGDVAHGLCAALSGCPSEGSPEQQIQHLLDEGISLGFEEATVESFHAERPVNIGQVGSFFQRIEETQGTPGYTPPGGYSSTSGSNNSPTCTNGFTVMASHIDSANGDDGCRPPHCDFGWDADGWCLPPANSDPPIIYVFGPANVDEDERNAGFRIVLSHATTQPVSVTVATQDGTATAGSDYRAANSRITLPVSHTVRYVSVPIINDSTYEGDEGETFMLAISEPSSNAELPETRQADTTIVDDDAEPFTGALPDFSAECVDGQITVNWRRPARVAGLNSYRYRIADNIDLFSNGEFYRTATISDLDQTSATVSVSDTSLTYWAGVRTNLHNAWAETDGFVCTESPPVVALDDTSLSVTEGSSVTINASLDKTSVGIVSVGLNASGATISPITCGVIPEADYSVDAELLTFTNTTSASITLHACDDTDTDRRNHHPRRSQPSASTGWNSGRPPQSW